MQPAPCERVDGTAGRPTLGLLCAAQFVVVLDVTIVAAYTLVFGGLLIAAGRVGDLSGRRRVFRAGLMTFGAASLACAVAASPAVLIAARAVQGAGAALMAPTALALVTAAFPGRRDALAWWTASAAAGGASGWVLGGVLVEAFGWPAVFAVNVPLCVAAALLVPRVLEESRGDVPALDVPGTIAITAGLALLVLGLTQLPAARPAAAAALVAFALIERRAADPILPAWALRRPGFVPANGVALALTATTTPAMFLAILYQQEELGRSALEAGLWSAPLNVAVIAGSALSLRAAMPAGLGAVAAGAGALLAGALPVAFVLMGLGLGCASVASTALGTAALPAGDQGVASGVLNAAAQVGSAVGLALFVPLGARAGWIAIAALALAAATGSLRTSRRRPTTPRR
jgi:MFS family permease